MKLTYIAKESWEEAYIKNALRVEDADFFVGTLKEHIDAVSPDTEILSVFVNSPVTAAELERLPHLKLITTRSTGFDHIDVEEAKKRNVAIATVPGYGAPTVAEFVFALLLALSRKIREANATLLKGIYSQEGLAGFDLSGKTIGVVGYGRIGAHVVRIAKGFDMRVLVYDVYQNNTAAAEVGFIYLDLPELLVQSDVISLHTPYMPETHHLINAKNIGSIKKGAYIINTARGALVETTALVEALKSGALGGAGLDVLEEEGDLMGVMSPLVAPHPKDNKRITIENQFLIQHPHVIVTPHIAFDTKEAISRILDTTVENIKAFVTGTPKNTLGQ